jgi:methylmalonyl-CoA mutase
MPKLRIEEAAARRQARIDRGEEVVVGVNKYQPDGNDDVEIRAVDNTAVREQQIARLRKLRETRDNARVQEALQRLTEGAASDANLLELSIEAVRARATVGEVSDALEKVFSRHRATIRSISGVYGSAYEGDEGYERIRHEIDDFAKSEGRRPRMLVVKMGQDGHDRGAKVIAPRSPTSASTSTWGRCSKRRRRQPAARSRTTCTSSASRARPPGTRRSCPS